MGMKHVQKALGSKHLSLVKRKKIFVNYFYLPYATKGSPLNGRKSYSLIWMVILVIEARAHSKQIIT